ncbi:MAG: N-acetyltransferase [Pseudomonadota bacterium]
MKIDAPELRESRPTERAALLALYAEAFPEEDLSKLLTDLLEMDGPKLSLVAVEGGAPVGHGFFTPCALKRPSGVETGVAALLGPLAVASRRRRKGVGGVIVREGLTRLRIAGFRQVHVLGDPAYYRRFGFEPDPAVAPPFELPADWAEAWRSLRLDDAAERTGGVLIPPEPWMRRSLWTP